MLGNRTVGLLAFVVVTLLATAAAAGWTAHGEAIALRLAQAGWSTCF